MSAQRWNTGLKLATAVVMAAILSACGTATVVKSSSPRGAHSTPQTSVAKPGQTATVRKGDTLYALARIHNITPRDLAAWNGLNEPYTIYPGQKIRLYPGGSTPGRAPTTVVTAPRPGTSAPAPAPPPVSTSTPIKNNISWRWPADGALVGRYVAADVTKQGIDIAGTSGQPVRATAPGVVVYSGAGLVGFGELIIIKHNEQWLSAYGHNRKRLVNEGQNVKAGDQIAEMGRTGTTRDMLHFEIRYNGKPVDPLQYLPAK